MNKGKSMNLKALIASRTKNWLSLILAIAASTGALGSRPLLANDWPQFRGPDRDGKSPETGLLAQWPPDGPTLLWTGQGCGKGYSSVSVVGKQLYTLGDEGDHQFVYCLDANSGKTIWRQKVGTANKGPYGGSRSTPTVDRGLLFVLTTDGELSCLDASDGKPKWQRNLVADAGAELMQAMDKIDWRFAESPLVDGEQVVVTPGTRTAAMIAFHRSSGDEIWRTKLPDLGPRGRDGAGYSSAIIHEAAGTRQYVQLIGRGLIGVESKSGNFLWSYNRIANDVANISSPVAVGDQIFASTGYQTGSALVSINGTMASTITTKEEYFLNPRTFQNHHGGFVVHDGYVYGGHGHKMGLPVCIRISDGKVMWGPVRNRGKASAAVCYADGHLYFRYQNGLMLLIEANPDRYVEKGSFTIPDVQAESWSHPAISNGKMYLKEQDRVLCYDIASQARAAPRPPDTRK